MRLHGSLRAAIISGVLTACSSSTAPKPTMAGTWHVALGALTSGTLTPNTFDVTVTKTGSSYAVTMPTLTWSGGLVFDSGPNLEQFSDTTYAGFVALTHAPHSHLCQGVAVFGLKNSGIDTLTGGQVSVENADTVAGGTARHRP